MTEAQKQTWKEYKKTVLSKLTYQDVYGQIKGQKNGNDHWVSGFCPLHDDTKKRSFAFNKQDKSWACFSPTCGKGSAFDFIMQTSGRSFKDTLLDLGNKLNIPPPTSKPSDSETKPPIPEKLTKQYSENINKKILKYLLNERGLTLAIIKKYQIGWDTKTKRYTIPIKDEHNNLANIRLYDPGAKDTGFKMISYTVLKENPKNKKDKWRYGEARLFGLDELVECKENQVIICEGEWDRLVLQQNGFMAVTGTTGGGTFLKKWTNHFKDKDVVLLFDCDEPGKEGAKKAIEAFNRSEINSIKNVFLPLKGTKDDKDVTDFFHKHDFTKENLQQLINSVPAHEYEATPVWFDLSTGVKGRFLPPPLAEHLLDTHNFVYDREEIYIYEDGVYQPKGKGFIHKQIQKILGEEFNENRAREVVFYIQTKLCDTAILDKEPRYVNVKNGLLDWIPETPKIIPHTHEYLSSIRIPLKHDTSSECPNIDRFLAEVLPPDCTELAEELFGYCMIPDTRFEKAFMLIGSGANGKSTFLKLLQAFIGIKNISGESLQQLAEDKFRAAELVGKLVNIFPDLSDMPLENTSYFKALTSGDMISVERKHKNPFKLQNTARMIFSANEIPRSKDVTLAFYRRWVIMRFPNTFEAGKADPGLLNKLITQEEMSGLLCKAIKGLVRLFANEKFSEPESIQAELKRYQLINDTTKAFVEEVCITGEGYSVGKKDLYREYGEWCKEGNYRPISVRKFNERLQNIVSIKEIRYPSPRIWVGIGIKQE